MIHRLDLRALVPVQIFLLALTLGACGSGSSTSDSGPASVPQGKEERPSVSPAARSRSVEGVEKVAPTGVKPRIAASLGSPPPRLVIRKLKEGSGGRVRRGERLGARFIGINYKTKQVQDFWGDVRGESPVAPYRFALGEGQVRKGWEIALPGQRLGTRLELLLPSRFAYGEGPMRYVVELLEREKPEREG
jgi:peptidylprolyl isomerase